MIYGIEDTTLTALGDTIRNKLNVEPYVKPDTFKLNYSLSQNDDIDTTRSFSFEGASKIKAIIDVVWDNKQNKFPNPVCVAPGIFKNDAIIPSSSRVITLDKNTQFPITIIVDGRDISFGITQGNGFETANVSVELFALDADGNDYFLTPLEMINKISNMDVLPPEAYEITGNCENMFAHGRFNWLINKYGNKIITNNITATSMMFYSNSTLEEIPFVINCDTTKSFSIASMFAYCYKLKTPPIMTVKPTSMSSVFNSCHNLRRIPDNYFDTWIWTTDYSSAGSTANTMSSIFQYCYSLRHYPEAVYQHINPKANYSNTIYNYMISKCYSIDELMNIPVYTETIYTSNMFRDSFTECDRLMNMTFAVQDDGTPYAVKWKSQTIDLSTAGHFGGFNLPEESRCVQYNSGITTDKRVSNDETYHLLKNDPDWYCGSTTRYSRYNHDSAVRTINSLPDASAYLATTSGTNTIKFKGEAGSATDGGAINTLTAEEIAVATAKGWTVSLA